MDTPRVTPDLIARFIAIVGPGHALTDPRDQAPFLTEWRGRWHGHTPVVLRPGSTAEVAAICRLATETGTPIVPQGGNTGLVGSQVPDESGREIVVSLSRLNRIREVDPAGNTMTVEAGVILENVQAAADAVDRLFPLSLASEGSCQIGGNISSNAGGTAVLSYGNTRDLVLGLEVVLPTGEILPGLRKLKKDNAGYDMKHLFIGSEGTLGIITAAVLKLFPRPRARAVAFVAVPSPAHAVALLNRARAAAGSDLVTFELICRRVLEFALTHAPGARDPLAEVSPWYVLTEIVGADDARARTAMETVLGDGLEAGEATDAVLAESIEQGRALWALRHSLSEMQIHEGGSIKHDVSLPVASVPVFLERATAAVEALIPGCRPVPFGHLGDGNIHFNVSQPVGADKAAYLARWDEMNTVVHDIVAEMNGSFAAEHGVGRLKRHILPTARSPEDMSLMRRLKATLDPAGILNPGRVI